MQSFSGEKVGKKKGKREVSQYVPQGNFRNWKICDRWVGCSKTVLLHKLLAKILIIKANTGSIFAKNHRNYIKNLAKITGKQLRKSLFFNKVNKRDTLTQVFYCELYKTFKNTSFTEHTRTTASTFTLHSLICFV